MVQDRLTMILRILTGSVLVLLLTVATSTALDPAPASLRYVMTFFRHGIRNPMEFAILPNDPNTAKLKELGGGQFASLTSIGKQQMYSVGHSLRQRYGSFIGGYQKDKVTVTSTMNTRTVMSALCFTAGLLPPSPQIFRTLPWQPVPVRAQTFDFEKGYVFLEKDPSNCPRYSAMAEKASLEYNSPDTREQYKTVYDFVRTHTGDPSIKTPAQMYNFFDSFYFAYRNDLPLPEWATAPRPELGGLPLFPDIVVLFAVDFFESVMYHRQNEDMLFIFSGPLMNIITSKLQKVSSATPGEERFWYHSTHDTTIYPLLRALKLEDPLTAEPGDGVIIEVHLRNGKYFVKMFMYDSIPDKLTELRAPMCRVPCTLDKFIRHAKVLTPKQWEEFCNK